jgi:hypothetical protein
MLREYALTPQVFSSSAFENTEVRRLALRLLEPELIGGAGVVRNLADGKWEAATWAEVGPNDILGDKFLRALLARGKVRSFAPATGPFGTEAEWIGLAEADNAERPLRGVICSPAAPATNNPLVSDVRSLDQCDWWTDHTNITNWALKRSFVDYRKFFEPLFVYSKEVMFVDQYLDPTEPSYAEFRQLLKFLHFRNRHCRVSIQRGSHKRDHGPRPHEISKDEWKDRFQPLADFSGHSFELVLRRQPDAYLVTEISPHERFFVSNLALLSTTNGFDTGIGMMTVTLLNRASALEHRRFFERTYGVGVQTVTFVPKASEGKTESVT